jgi:mannosyltransferase OCH1-like enzyme
MKQIHIFTFWEPKINIPGYIKLCIRTWQIIFPNKIVIILDYSNLYQYLKPSLISKILCKKMGMKVQADAIRVAILKTYGGIWMDADTILINTSFIKRFYGYELATLSYHIGFIYASKNSIFISKWLRKIIKKVNIYKKVLSRNFTKH